MVENVPIITVNEEISSLEKAPKNNSSQGNLVVDTQLANDFTLLFVPNSPTIRLSFTSVFLTPPGSPVTRKKFSQAPKKVFLKKNPTCYGYFFGSSK